MAVSSGGVVLVMVPATGAGSAAVLRVGAGALARATDSAAGQQRNVCSGCLALAQCAVAPAAAALLRCAWRPVGEVAKGCCLSACASGLLGLLARAADGRSGPGGRGRRRAMDAADPRRR